MSTDRFSRGGFTPVIDAPKTPMLVREDGLVSFDGERGPWMRILTPAETREYGAKALKQ